MMRSKFTGIFWQNPQKREQRTFSYDLEALSKFLPLFPKETVEKVGVIRYNYLVHNILSDWAGSPDRRNEVIMERKVGTVSRGIRGPIIREGDDLAKIVVRSVLEAAESEGYALRDYLFSSVDLRP